MTSRRRPALLALLASLFAAFALAAPAQGADKVVTITSEGVRPKVLEVARGDTVTFVNEDTSFGYRARATSDNWDLDSGPVGLLPGRRYTHPDPITEPGTYTFRVAEGAPFEGSVLLRGAASTSGPTPGPGSGGNPPPPPPGGGGNPPPPGPPPGGGSGTAQPPVNGGFGSFGNPPPPAPGAPAPPPAIALPDLPAATAAPAPETAAEPEQDDGTTVVAVPGRLGSPPTARGYGLPAALAAVLAAGVASLLVRLLLAEPAARRRARSTLAGPSAVPAVD